MAHVQSQYVKLWKPQDISIDKISSQKMFIDNIDALEAFALSIIRRSAEPVISINALRAINTSDSNIFIDGTTVAVKSVGLYIFDRGSTDTDNNNTVIAPTVGGGRWISVNKSLGDLAFKDAITKSDIGLGNVPNVATNDQTPTYTQAGTLATLVSGEKLSVSFSKIMKAITDLISHLANKSNPHGVTKAQVGLGNVDNTSDADKPISIAVQSALDQLGGSGSGQAIEFTAHKNNTSNPHSVTKAQVGLGNVDNTSDTNKPVSTAQATAIADAKKAGTDAQTNLGTHIGTKTNPHDVTASQVGLGNVPNVATNDQTPTYTQAGTLATLVSGEKLSVSFGKVMKAITDLISHLANKSNPHGVTASQIGLGNVDNTSDANKPVSTAQQTAINGVQTNLTNHTNTKTNPHGVTASQVGAVPTVSSPVTNDVPILNSSGGIIDSGIGISEVNTLRHGSTIADIPSGASFDNYLTVGRYRVRTDAIAATLINKPSSYRGLLTVKNLLTNVKTLTVDSNGVGASFIQEYTDTLGITYVRRMDISYDDYDNRYGLGFGPWSRATTATANTMVENVEVI